MFELEEVAGQGSDGNSTVIKVVGVGGAGGNAVDHMIREGVGGVEFICCNTDSQALKKSNAHVKLQLGPGLGLAESRSEWIKVFQQGLRQGMRRIAPNLGMIVFGVFMIGEQVYWLIPLWGGESSQDTIMSVQDALIASFSATPEKAGLEAAMAIGIVRFVLIFGALYAVGFTVIKREKLRDVIANPHNKDAVFYGGCFLIFWLFGMVLRVDAGSGFAVFEKGMNTAQSLCVLFYSTISLKQVRKNLN